jgi:hypothetical protein
VLPLPDLGPLLADELATGHPELTAELAPSTHPLALLPVRLETRFFPAPDGAPDGAAELRVRVYPDKVHLDAHDPALTGEEIAAGTTYWRLQWAAGDDLDRQRQAWQQLADRFEPGRAAWVARTLTPTNASARSSSATPVFPDVPPGTGVSPTPVARLLPRRWTATAYRDGSVLAVATGQDVRPDLKIGPDLGEPLPSDPAAAPVDSGMAWMVDFAEAEAAGMALRLTLPDSAGVDVLVVAGTCDLSADDGATRFAGQLDAHHWTDGLAFLAPGTPSNNTTGERAGYASRDLRGAASFPVEALPVTIAPGSAADRAAGAFGVDQQTFAVDGHDGRDADVAAAMTTALWPATWGYFLTQFAGVGADDAQWARGHAREHLRPGGTLPVIRCGRQPYGVLPVTSLGRFSSPGDEAARLDRVRSILAGLRDAVWRPALAGVARVGRTDDPNGDVVDVLRTDAISTSVLVRRLMGPHYLRHLRLFLGEDLDALGFWPVLQSMTAAAADRAGLGTRPPISRVVYDPGTRPLTVPLVQPADYLAELAGTTDVDALARPVPGDGVPLLHALLRHGLLREYAEAAARLLAGASPVPAALLTDAELVDLVPGQPPTPTWSWQRDQVVPGSAPEVTVAAALAEAARTGPLGEFRAAVRTLAATPPETLERHLLQVLDATSHRLDAWATSLADRRLAELRQSRPTGLLVGGYGWVEGLRPEPSSPVSELPPDEPGPLVAAEDDPGFVHAPSLGQASAAALLRNAHLAHGGAADGPYAMQLTSERVRTARRLFDGVRQGQPLGALLGYEVERRLHDARLDDLVDDLRELAPRPGESGPDARDRRLILDGLVLHRQWHDDPDGLLARLPGLGDRRPVLVGVLHALDAAVDATADAVTAESVHQLVRGNLSRSSGSLDAIASGDSAPPPLEFMDTPRTGTAVTHRVAVLLDAGLTPPAGWTADTPRARAEPVLNAWVGQLLGPATGELVGLAPLDLLTMTADQFTSPPTDQLTVAGSIRALVAGARGLDGGDLQPPHVEPVRGLDLDEYEQRAAAAHEALSALTSLTSLTLNQAAQFGIAVPAAVTGPAGDLVTGAVRAEVRRRSADADSYAEAPAGETPEARRDRVQRRFTAVFGPGFVAVPRFRIDGADLRASLDDPTLTGDDPFAADTWLLRMERLRPGVARLGAALRQARVLAETETITDAALLDLAQVPHTAGQRWVGLPLADDQPLREGVASLALHGAPADLQGPLAGLFVDEWTEVVPRTEETTGIAFRYDPPDAMAPQAILLAVPPVVGEPWTVGTVNQVLLETLDLAHLRALGPEALGDAGQYLPATTLAFNADGDAVSTDLTALTS